ncbi:hypothetical protein VE02_06772 [Pseudogymnoascus sp. 03VT05]|nr:hypothetical protein VE02_06772 [Pseudogymnoascus sp. 03VT05]
MAESMLVKFVSIIAQELSRTTGSFTFLLKSHRRWLFSDVSVVNTSIPSFGPLTVVGKPGGKDSNVTYAVPRTVRPEYPVTSIGGIMFQRFATVESLFANGFA